MTRRTSAYTTEHSSIRFSPVRALSDIYHVLSELGEEERIVDVKLTRWPPTETSPELFGAHVYPRERNKT